MEALGRRHKDALKADQLIGEFVGQHGHVPERGPESKAFLADVAREHGRAVRDYAAGLLLRAGLEARRPGGCKLGEVPVHIFLQAVCKHSYAHPCYLEGIAGAHVAVLANRCTKFPCTCSRTVWPFAAASAYSFAMASVRTC